MFKLLHNLSLGFSVAFSPANLGFALLGCLMGTLIGVLPGVGPLTALALLLPITFYLTPVAALIMLAGIYYGAQYGGSTTAILVNLPGETSSIVTCLDGHQMARQGRAGSALAIAALSSFFAGTIATLLLAVVATPLAHIGQAFGSAEYFSLMVLGLVGAAVLARGALVKTFGAIALGLLIGLVGTDLTTGTERFTFGIPELFDGVGFIPVAVGMFGIADIISNLSSQNMDRVAVTARVGRLWPTRQEFAKAWPAATRGTAIGAILGLLPGGGALLSSFASYVVEKSIAKDPSRFGQGAVEGVAGPEAANNAGAQTSFIPMLALGVPSNPLMAIMIGALMIQGIAPGPQVMTQNPQLFWGVVASMWIGNAMLLVINLPLIWIWISILRIPYRALFPAILLFCVLGVYLANNNSFEVAIAAIFGLLGYFFYRVGCDAPALILAMLLGPLMEENLRRTLSLSGGDPMVLVQKPISASFLIAALVLLVILVLPNVRKGRDAVFQE